MRVSNTIPINSRIFTMIIIPMAILVLILIVGSFFATRQSTVTSTGIVEPQNTLNIANRNYHEGQLLEEIEKNG